MYNFRRVILPVIVVLILLAAFISRLSSCSSSSTNGGSSPAAENTAAPSAGISPSSEASPSASTQAATVSPTPPYTDAEIKSIYNSLDLSVVEIRDAGDATMVHYYSPSGVPDEIVSRFDWFDRSTGARNLVFGWAYTDKFEIKADKSFTVLTTGLSYIDGGRSFPEFFTSTYSDIDGAVKFIEMEQKYFAPLDKSYTIGINRHESLTDINFNGNFMSLGFGVQPGHENEFYAAYACIPEMTVTNEAGYSTITLSKTILSADFKKPANQENHYCSLVSVTCDGTDTIVKLKLNEKTVRRYNISAERSPESDMPYAVIEYTNIYPDYPTGW